MEMLLACHLHNHTNTQKHWPSAFVKKEKAIRFSFFKIIFFSSILVWPVLLAQVCTHYPINFSFQNHFFNLIEFSMTKKIQNSISPIHLRFKSPNSPSLNAGHQGPAFQQCQGHAQKLI
jgi:hypothetical protein